MSKSPTFQFHDVYLPAEIVQSIVNGTITKTGIGVLILVKSLTACGKHKCWASNKYIARSVHSTPNHISAIIAELSRQDLLVVKYNKEGSRYLQPAWDWQVTKFHKGGKENSLKCTTKVRYHKNIKNKQEKIKHGRRLTPDDNVCSTPLLNGKSKHLPVERSLAVRLYEILEKYRKVMRRPKDGFRAWSLEFRKALEFRSPAEIATALDGFEKHFNYQYMPSTYSAESFCRRLHEVEEAIQRAEGRNGKKAIKPKSPDYPIYPNGRGAPLDTDYKECRTSKQVWRKSRRPDGSIGVMPVAWDNWDNED